MQIAKRIILAANAPDVSGLFEPLRFNGAEVTLCTDGAQALEKALTWSPSLLVLDTAIGLIPAPKLCQILRANPRTGTTPFLFVGDEGEEVEGFHRHRDRFVSRPLNREEIIATVQGFFKRQERIEAVRRQEKDIEGTFKEVPLVDLLQVLGTNRKDGILFLSDEERQGEIHLQGGHVANARVGRIEGNKAFLRLLTWPQGHFRFESGGAEGERKISLPTERLIMEGLRQVDEMASLRRQFPFDEGALSLAIAPDELPRGLRPATREVLLSLQSFHRLEEVLDNCTPNDFLILQILRALIEMGVVRIERGESVEASQRDPLLSAADVLSIREKLGEQDQLLEEASVKLILLADSGKELRAFVQRLTGVAEFSLDSDFQKTRGESYLGDIGWLRIGETFSLRLVALPVSAPLGPLWHPFRRRLLGVLSLSLSDSVRRAEDFFRSGGTVPGVRVDLTDEGIQCLPERVGDRKSLKRMLGFFAAFYAGKLLPEETI